MSFACKRVSDAVRTAVAFSELKWKNWERRHGKKREDASIMHVAYEKVNDWQHYIETPLDRAMAKLERSL